MTMPRHPARVRAFTVIELLVVMGILAVLAGVAVPLYARVTQSARAAACVSNLRQLGAGLGLYLGDHNQRMPVLLSARKYRTDPGPVIDDTLNTYVTDPRVFACPADVNGVAARSGTSYYWNVLINGQSAAALHMLNLSATNSQIPGPVRRGPVPSLPAVPGQSPVRRRTCGQRNHLRDEQQQRKLTATGTTET